MKIEQRIRGIESMSLKQISEEIEKGGRFVYYIRCYSVILFTIKQPSDIFFVRQGQPSPPERWLWVLFSLALGWWGLPWGPLYTLETVLINLSGGENVTDKVIDRLIPHEHQKKLFKKTSAENVKKTHKRFPF